MNKKGITLVALVVTIIVLLILAGITIALVLGDDGIVKRAQEGGARQNLNAEGERIRSAGVALITDYVTDPEFKAIIDGTGSGGDAKTTIETKMNEVLGSGTLTGGTFAAKKYTWTKTEGKYTLKVELDFANLAPGYKVEKQ